MTTINLVVLVCTLIIFLHFVQVIYTHWQNADLPEAEGGCPKMQPRLAQQNHAQIELDALGGKQVPDTDVTGESAEDDEDPEIYA